MLYPPAPYPPARGPAAALFGLVLIVLSVFPAPISRGAAGGSIQIIDAKARPTLPNANGGVVYLTIVNHGAQDDTLTSVTASVAEAATMHRTENAGGVMSMKPVGPLPVKAEGTVRFAPNGLHIMLTGLKRQLKTGDSFPITLNFDTAGAITAAVAVGPVTTAVPGSGAPSAGRL